MNSIKTVLSKLEPLTEEESRLKKDLESIFSGSAGHLGGIPDKIVLAVKSDYTKAIDLALDQEIAHHPRLKPSKKIRK
jgi:hypothetical protein